MAFELTSPSFEAGAEIPKKFTCDGEDVSPALEWAGAPDDTAALVLIVDDADARDFIHWVVAAGIAESLPDPPEEHGDGLRSAIRV
jgi:phosphatidylethanolamine-binding protein (PEBP) family uncharacterized protein